MPWLFQNPEGETREALAVAIHDTATGALIGYVEPDDIAAALTGDIDPDGLRHIAAQMPEPPTGRLVLALRVWWQEPSA